MICVEIARWVNDQLTVCESRVFLKVLQASRKINIISKCDLTLPNSFLLGAFGVQNNSTCLWCSLRCRSYIGALLNSFISETSTLCSGKPLRFPDRSPKSSKICSVKCALLYFYVGYSFYCRLGWEYLVLNAVLDGKMNFYKRYPV